MAINAQTTLRRLVWEMEQWANAHDMIEQFGYGNYLDVYASQTNNTYPAFIVNCPNFTMDEWYFNFTIELITLDWVFDNRENHDRATSDTAELVRDLYNTIKQSKRWQSFARLDADWNGRHIDEFGGDKAFGWMSTFVIKVKKRSGICQLETLMPEYDFDSQAVIVPSCDPVDVTVNTEAYSTTASGGSVNIPLVNTDGDSVTATVNAGVNVELPNVSWTDSDGTPQSTPYQDAIVCATASTPLNTSTHYKSGQTSSTGTGDNPTRGRGVDFITLNHNNPFGNTNRFTDELGGQTYANGLICDWAFWDQVSGDFDMWHRTILGPADWASSLALCVACTEGGFTDWSMPSLTDYNGIYWKEIISGGQIELLNYAPFNININSQSLRMWCMDRMESLRYQTLNESGNFQAANDSSIQSVIPKRTANVGEL